MTFNEMLARKPWDEMNMKKHGVINSGMLIFHDSWLELIKQTPHVVEAYEKSKYQKDLDKFINNNLSQYVYKRAQ